MKHFPAPITDDRDHWLMVGDGQVELKHSETAVHDEISEYDPWWNTILLINSGHGICRDVTADFLGGPDFHECEAPDALRRWHEGRV